MFRELFPNHTEAQVFDALVEAFHEQLEKNSLAHSLEWKQLNAALRPLIDVHQWNHLDTERWGKLGDHSPEVVNFPDYQKLSGAAWRFVALNYAYPLLEGSSEHRLRKLTLTDLGRRVCSKKPENNPTRDGYIERLRQANPKIEEEVFERLFDAKSCLDAGLGRPAIVMIGISAELTLKEAYQAMKTLVLITKAKDVEFREQLEAVLGQVDNVPDITNEQKHRLKMALEAVEPIRVLRNNAAHHGNPPPDPYLAHDRLGAACLHLPVIWNDLILPNKP